MAQFWATRRAVVLWFIMLLVGCFFLFVFLGAVDLSPSKQRQQPDQTKDILLVDVVCDFVVCFFSFRQESNKLINTFHYNNLTKTIWYF